MSTQQENGATRFCTTVSVFALACTAYALLIPERAIDDNPWLGAAVGQVEAVLPAISGLAKHSPIPDVVRIYYATMWLLFPAMLVAEFALDPFSLRKGPPRAKGFMLLSGAVALGLLGAFLIYMFAFFVKADSAVPRDVLTGGRGGAVLVALTANPISIGISSSILFTAISFFVSSSIVLTRNFFNGDQHA